MRNQGSLFLLQCRFQTREARDEEWASRAGHGFWGAHLQRTPKKRQICPLEGKKYAIGFTEKWKQFSILPEDKFPTEGNLRRILSEPATSISAL
jgi:hypothetical protein